MGENLSPDEPNYITTSTVIVRQKMVSNISPDPVVQKCMLMSDSPTDAFEAV